MSGDLIVASADDLTGRARLRAAAVRLFAERGVAGVSVREIAAVAGVTAGLVTHCFGSKNGLKAAVDELMVEVFTMPLSNQQQGTPQERFTAIGSALSKTMSAHPDLRAYLRRSFLENDPASKELFVQFVTLIRDIQNDMSEAQQLRSDLDREWAPFQVLFLHFGPLLFEPVVEEAIGVGAYEGEVIERRSHAMLQLLNHGHLDEFRRGDGDRHG